ncbi:MAG: hypothetical protein WD154_05950 [Nitrosopumilaceae archaeon]
MRNDSCRKCGNELKINQNCESCSEPIEFVCHTCGNITDEQIHSECINKLVLVIKV